MFEFRILGCYFIWNNKYEGDGRIFSKFDRILVNDSWLIILFNSDCYVYIEGSFDYCFLVIKLDNVKKVRRREFKFFNMWFNMIFF